MTNHFTYLIVIFTLLILLITFGEYLNPNGWSHYLSTKSTNVSPESILNGLKF
jgi:hypothetical protein